MILVGKKINFMHIDEFIARLKQRRNELAITLNHLAELSGVGLRTL